MDVAGAGFVPSPRKKYWCAALPHGPVTVAVLGIKRGGDAVSVCRLSIQSDCEGEPTTVDLALPTGTPVAVLLPAVVALAEQPLHESPQCWRLDRLSGSSLDESMTLAENGVHDGELLVLVPADAASLGLARWDPCRTVADARLQTEPRAADARPNTSEVGCALAAILGSSALCAIASGNPPLHLAIAAIGTCAAAAAAVVMGKSAGLGVAAVSLAAATGFLVVPSGPAAANVFLAAVAAFSTSLLLLRWTHRHTATLTATATLSGLVAAATITPVLVAVPVAAVGASLAVAALGLLASSARISITLSGLVADRHTDECDARAVTALTTLTGLVAGCTGGAALGVLLVAVGCHRQDAPGLAGACFAVVVAAVLFLRVPSHADGARRALLIAGGLTSASAAFAIVVTTAPGQAGWASAVVIAAGLGAVHRPHVGARALRAVRAIEYGALAAVVPLACWVGGAYAMVRGAALP
jgi:type VII secretion integral membrane protein EccD